MELLKNQNLYEVLKIFLEEENLERFVMVEVVGEGEELMVLLVVMEAVVEEQLI